MIKLCLMCNNFKYSKPEYTYYSTLTGGDLSGGASCDKRHFDEYDSRKPEDETELVAFLAKAETCKDFKVTVNRITIYPNK